VPCLVVRGDVEVRLGPGDRERREPFWPIGTMPGSMSGGHASSRRPKAAARWRSCVEPACPSPASGAGCGASWRRASTTCCATRLLRGEEGPGDGFAVARGDGVDGFRLARRLCRRGRGGAATKPVTAEELETDRLKAKVGELTIEGKLLRKKMFAWSAAL
jgi:hypothetical protein